MTVTAIRPDTCSAPRHGTASAYTSARCRCAQAREAWRLYNKRRREGRNPTHLVVSTGTARRVRALIALGWNFRALARQAGCAHRTVQDLAYARRPVITVHTARWVSDLYERLSTTRPEGWVADRARNMAASRGWVPPLAWDDIDDPHAQPNLGDEQPDLIDPIAVERALAGEHVRLTDAERDEAFRLGLARGMTGYAIGKALHMSATSYKAVVARLAKAA